jgi:hypothetical protein
MNANEMTLEVFDALLARANFRLLNENDAITYGGARDIYGGSGPRCLIATVDDFDILFEEGTFNVFYLNEESGAIWCVGFTEDGEREEIF